MFHLFDEHVIDIGGFFGFILFLPSLSSFIENEDGKFCCGYYDVVMSSYLFSLAFYLGEVGGLLD